MIRLKRIIGLAVAVAMMSSLCAGTAMAANTKKINSVTVTIEGNIEADSKFGDEDIEINTVSGHYYYDYYETNNDGFRWSTDDVPELKIYLRADEGYYFNIKKASDVKITGGTYKSAAREDSSTTLVLTVTMPSLANQVYPIETATFTDKGLCSWDEAINAGSYEVKFMRGNTTLGGTQTTTALTMDNSQYMTKEGDYFFKVRAINKNDTSVGSPWVESNHSFLSGVDAAANRQAAIESQSAGTWIQDSVGWWFKLPDNTYPASAWRQIYGEWYYFKADGYMATGWQQVGDKWYYLDPTSGAMWKNTTTPDGYFVSIDGSMAAK